MIPKASVSKIEIEEKNLGGFSVQDFRALQLEAVIGIFTISGMVNIRALTVWRKPVKLEV